MAGGIGIGALTFAVWNSSSSTPQDGTAASVTLNVGGSASLQADLDELVPGSFRDVTVGVSNSSSVPVTLDYAAQGDGGAAIITDLADGLRTRVWWCSVAYVAGSCPGIETEATTGAGVDVGSGTSTSSWSSTTAAGETAYLRIRVYLPLTAPPTMQGNAFTITHVFSAIAVAGGSS